MRSNRVQSATAVAAVGLVAGFAVAARPASATKLNSAPHQRNLAAAVQPGPRGPEASFTFPAFSTVVNNDAGITGLDPESQPLVGAPAGVYTGFSVSAQWSAVSGDPWSDEAIWAFTDTGDLNTAVTFYADPGTAPNSAGNGNPVTLTWNGFMDTPYNAANPLYMLMAQTFSGSTANWNNVSVTINDSAPTPPPFVNAVVGGSLTGILAVSQVNWYKFGYSGSGPLNFNTLGSTLGPDNDTEIALYGPTGGLIDTNDDIDFAGGNFLSELSFFDGELPAGDYYLAVGGFNTSFGPAFNATSTSGETGTYVVNGLSIPEPTGIAAIAAAATGMFVRRRRA